MDISFYIVMGITAFICGLVMALRKDKKKQQRIKFISESDWKELAQWMESHNKDTQTEKVEDTTNNPSFNRDELSALCTIALSLVDGKIYNPNRMTTFMHEQEGFDEEVVYRKIHSIIDDFDGAFARIKNMTALNKREYAACFFAATINSAEFDANRDSEYVVGWQNCVKYLLRLNDERYLNYNVALEKYANRKTTTN